jgi:undecaprenyl-diphosphatase
MLDKILSLDTELLIFLNGLGSERFDNLWLIITNNSIDSFFLFLLFFIYKKLGKQTLFILAIAVLITFTDQMTTYSKMDFKDPCSNPEINTIRVVQSRSSFSFFSGHASNSMALPHLCIALCIAIINLYYYSYGY